MTRRKKTVKHRRRKSSRFSGASKVLSRIRRRSSTSSKFDINNALLLAASNVGYNFIKSKFGGNVFLQGLGDYGLPAIVGVAGHMLGIKQVVDVAVIKASDSMARTLNLAGDDINIIGAGSSIVDQLNELSRKQGNQELSGRQTIDADYAVLSGESMEYGNEKFSF